MSGPDDDDLVFRDVPQHGTSLNNSEVSKSLQQHLSNLSIPQRKDITQLLCKFPALFNDTPSQTNVVQHDIVLVKDTTAIRQHPYRVNSVIKKEVKYLCDNGLAKPSVSLWSSPCLLVPKPVRSGSART